MPVLVGLGGLGAPELLIILAIIVVLFGATKITGIGGAIGGAIREFRKELKTPDAEEKAAKAEPTAPTSEQPRDRSSLQH